MAHRGGGESPMNGRGANVGKGPIDSPRSLGRQPGRRGDAPRGKALDFRARNKAKGTNNEWRKDQKDSSSPGTASARSIERGANNGCRKDRKDSPSPVRTKRQAIEKKVDAELRRKDRQPSAEDRSVTKKNKKKSISKQTTPERAGRIEEWVCQYLAGTTDGSGKLAAIGAAIPDDVFDRDIDGPLKQVLLHSTRLQIDGHDIFLVGAENPSLALEEEFSSVASALPGSSALTTETDAEALTVLPPEESSNEMCMEKEQEPSTDFVGTREEVEAVELLVQEEGELHLEEARKLLAAVIATCIKAEKQTVDARAKEAPHQAAQEEVNAALAEVAAQEEAKKRRTEELQRKMQEGGIVQRNRAKNELAQLLEADPLPLRKARITLEAARKKADKARAPFEAARKAAEEVEEEARQKVAEAEAYLAHARKRGAEQFHDTELSRIEMELQEQKHLSATCKSRLLFTTLNV